MFKVGDQVMIRKDLVSYLIKNGLYPDGLSNSLYKEAEGKRTIIIAISEGQACPLTLDNIPFLLKNEEVVLLEGKLDKLKKELMKEEK